MPVRRHGFRRALHSLIDWLYPVEHDRTTLQAARRRRAAVFGGTVGAVLALAASAVAQAPERTSLETQLEEGQRIAAETSATAAPATAPSPVPSASSPAVLPTPATSPAPNDAASAPTAVAPAGERVQVVGDSVTVGAAAMLAEAMPGIRIDAEVGKQFATGVEQVEALSAAGELRGYLVVALGTNGSVGADNLERLIAAAGDRPIVLVTPYGDRSWIPGAVDDLRAAASRHPNVVLADWSAAVAVDPSVLGPDGIHPHASGVQLFVSLVEDALTRASTL